jgi:hypothetical protein
MPPALLPPASVNVNDVLETAKAVFLRTLAKCLPVALAAILCSQLASLYWMTTGRPDGLKDPRDGTFWVLLAAGWVVYTLLAALLMLRQRALLDGRLPELRTELQTLLPRWLPLLLMSLMAGLATFFATLAFIVPGLYLAVALLVAQPVMVLEGAEPLAALQRSFRLIRPHWWRAFATAVFALLIVIVCWLLAASAIGLLGGLLKAMGLSASAVTAVGAACMLAAQAVAVVYFSATAAAAHSAASSSA